MARVLGIDSSTQSCKALLVDSDDGTVAETWTSPHPAGTEVDPRAWLSAVDEVLDGLLPQADGVAVGGQQHGMVTLDDRGRPVRDALLWNDTRSAEATADLVAELGGAQACADLVGSVLVPSFTVTKLRWLRDHEPDNAARTTQVLLPHDYVSRHLCEPGTAAFTDRGDASGTGYFSSAAAGGAGAWLTDLQTLALGRPAALPRVVPPGAVAGLTPGGAVVAAGTGDHMAAALGLGLGVGDVLLSVGTSGVASAVSPVPVTDRTGVVTGFADASGGWLPAVTTTNAAGILDLQARWLGVDHDTLSDLALASSPGAGGVTLLPYYGGERTPDRPGATGVWTGLRPTTTREDLARAAFEALLCSLADAVDRLAAGTGVEPERVILVGGATRSRALRTLAPAVIGRPVVVLPEGEHVARGAARLAAWALAGTPEPPSWPLPGAELLEAAPTPAVRDQYAWLRDH